MSDITANVVVSQPAQLFTLARSFKANANGKIYIGKIDTDPTQSENQIQVYLENEDGSYVPVAQPLIINAGGYPVYNGQIAKFVTVEGHSMAIYNAYGVQEFYYPNVLKYDPDQLRQELAGNGGAAEIGTSNGDNVQQALDKTNRRYLYAVDYLPEGYVTNGSVDYLPELQQALDDAAASGKAVIMPDFQVMINPIDEINITGLMIPSNSEIIFLSRSSLKVKPNSLTQYGILTINTQSNIKIYNPVLYGDKYNHLGTDGEWGMGVFIRGACENITIENPKCYEMWGDGYFIGQKNNGDGTAPKNIIIRNPIADRCRRQGMSVTSADGLIVMNPVFSNTKSSDSATPLPNGPHAGIDIEPDSYKSKLNRIYIENISGSGNDAGLLYIALGLTDKDKIIGDPDYNVDILVSGVSDNSSRGAIEVYGMPLTHPGYTGSIKVNNVTSVKAKRNAIMIQDWFITGRLPIVIDGVSISNWQSSMSTDIDRAPISFRCSESATYPASQSPQTGPITVNHVFLGNDYDQGNISTYAIYTTPHNGFNSVYVNFDSVMSSKNLKTNIFGRMCLSYGDISNGLKQLVSSNMTLNATEMQDYVYNTTHTMTLPSSFDGRFINQEYRLIIDTSSGTEYVKIDFNGNPCFVNGAPMTATYGNFYASAGVIKIKVGKGIIFIKTEGAFTAS